MSRRTLLVAALACSAPALAAQSRSQELITNARALIASRDFPRADVALSGALESALYLLDSVNVFLWRGILEHLRGNGPQCGRST